MAQPARQIADNPPPWEGQTQAQLESYRRKLALWCKGTRTVEDRRVYLALKEFPQPIQRLVEQADQDRLGATGTYREMVSVDS